MARKNKLQCHLGNLVEYTSALDPSLLIGIVEETRIYAIISNFYRLLLHEVAETILKVVPISIVNLDLVARCRK
mgnify:CR=1 FL=1|jgi:hypothetical protein